MKTLLYISILLLSAIGCKSDDDNSPNPLFEELAGSWELVEIETGVITQSKWEPIVAGNEKTIKFRSDGLLMDENGLPVCCMSQAYIINGQLLKLEPTDDLPANPQCQYLDCVTPTVLEMTLLGDELVLLKCCGPNEKYRRKK